MSLLNITRRWFLVGSGAALASAKLSFPAVSADEVLLVPLHRSAGSVQIYEVEIVPNGADHTPLRFTFDWGERAHLDFALSSAGGLRWVGLPGNCITLPRMSALTIGCHPVPNDDANLMLGYLDQRGCNVLSIFKWVNGRASLINHSYLTEPQLE